VWFPMRFLRFFIYLFWVHYGPGIDSDPKINEYQGSFLGGKGVLCVGLRSLSSSCATCVKILEASTFWSPQGVSRPPRVDFRSTTRPVLEPTKFSIQWLICAFFPLDKLVIAFRWTAIFMESWDGWVIFHPSSPCASITLRLRTGTALVLPSYFTCQSWNAIRAPMALRLPGEAVATTGGLLFLCLCLILLALYLVPGIHKTASSHCLDFEMCK
jgi:hypothetical protein